MTSPRVAAPRGRPPKLPVHLRRALVLDAAVECFAAAGRAGTSIDEIAAAAGVRKPTIYELFGSKDGLFRAAVEHEVDALSNHFRMVNAETIHLEGTERTRRRIEAAFTYAEQRPQTFRLLARVPVAGADGDGGDEVAGGRQIRQRLVGVMADNYRRESRVRGTPLDGASEVLARLFFAMTEELIELDQSGAGPGRAALVDFLTDFIESGLAGIRPATWVRLDERRSAP